MSGQTLREAHDELREALRAFLEALDATALGQLSRAVLERLAALLHTEPGERPMANDFEIVTTTTSSAAHTVENRLNAFILDLSANRG